MAPRLPIALFLLSLGLLSLLAGVRASRRSR
jgi:hypothetical protein